MVSLSSQAEEDLRAFETHVKTLPEVRECHMLNGEIDFILKIVSQDLQSFQELLTSKLTPGAERRQREDLADDPDGEERARRAAGVMSARGGKRTVVWA